MFMLNHDELSKLRNECLKGERLCGDCKLILIEKIIHFLRNHQEKREKAKDMLDQYWISEKIDLKQLVSKETFKIK